MITPAARRRVATTLMAGVLLAACRSGAPDGVPTAAPSPTSTTTTGEPREQPSSNVTGRQGDGIRSDGVSPPDVG